MFWRKLLAEGLGTLLLVATVVGSGIMAERLADGNEAIALLGNTLATSAILVVLITIFGPISGAHFNPVVTLVAALRREIRLGEAAAFLITQILGAIAGTLLAHVMFGLQLIAPGGHVRSGWGIGIGEVAATFLLVITILGTRAARPSAVPLTVALAIGAGYWFTSSTSFANPAVTLARALTPTFAGIRPDDVAMFVICQLVGGFLAYGASALFWPPQKETPRVTGDHARGASAGPS